MSSAHPQNSGEGKTFLFIYLAITIVVLIAIFLVVRKNQAEEEARMAAMVEQQEKDRERQKAEEAKLLEEALAEKRAREKAEEERKKEAFSRENAMKETPDTPREEKPKKVAEEKPEEEKPETEQERRDREAAEVGVKPLLEIVGNWMAVPRNAYPKLVATRRSVEFEVEENGKVVAKGKLPAGAQMVPVELNGEELVLAMGSTVPVHVTVPVDETDFKEQVTAKYDAFVTRLREEAAAEATVAEAEAAKASAEVKALQQWNDGTDPRFGPVKASIQAGEVGDFSLIDALRWKWGNAEEVEGRMLETAHVIFVSEEDFGPLEVECRAFLDDGKVIRWLDVERGEEL